MGIPKFFRWAGDRYKAILSGILGVEENCPFIDNFYLDMNGIIHQSSHGNDNAASASKSFEDILQAVCEIVHRMVVDVVKPQRLIFLAIDGVAPRAKLNQQRARRFRSAHERSRQLAYAKLRGISSDETFDSNCITPGTEFMVRLGQGIRNFITKMMSTHPIWSVVEVIFSGCDVPGEGEHKIISYIRDQKSANNFPPNLRHCIYGADADMIMLALATHEPFTIILREVFQVPSRSEQQQKAPLTPEPPKMQFIRIHTLRQLLIGEFSEDLDPNTYDGERFLDDFVLLTFLIGNDFLPHLPGIDIGDNAFDMIFDAYKTAYYSEPGYLVSDGKLDYNRLELIFNLIGTIEAVVYQEKEVARATRGLRRQSSNSSTTSSNNDSFQSSTANHHNRGAAGAASLGPPAPPAVMMTPEEYRVLYYHTKFNLSLCPALMPSAEEQQDDQQQLKPIVQHYLAGLSWCLAYYTTGCISWSWYYPYHYGLFLQDMNNLQAIADDMQFDLDTPLTPFQQLLACLPPGSNELLPPPYRAIMTDEASPMKGMYPLDFMTDLNGKKNDYEAVVLLPFIDTASLLQAEALYCPPDDQNTLSLAERERNQFGVVYHYHYQVGTVHMTTEPTLNFQPGTIFAPRLIEGTLDSLPGFPPLSQLQTGSVFGRTVYFTRKASNKAIRRQQQREQKEKRTADAVANNRPINPQRHQSVRKHGRRQRQQEIGTFSVAQDSFPMPGWTMLPSLPAYDATIGYDDKSTTTIAAAAVIEAGEQAQLQGGWITVSYVLDANTDQFLAALGLQIQQRVPAFTALCNVDMTFGYAKYTSTPLPCQQRGGEGGAVAVMEIMQRVADIFAATRGKLTAQAMHLPSEGGRVVVLFEDISHLGQMEQFLYDHLIADIVQAAAAATEQGEDVKDDGVEASLSVASLSVEAVITTSNGSSGNGHCNNGNGSSLSTASAAAAAIAATTTAEGEPQEDQDHVQLFHRMITLGYYTAADGSAFAQWLSTELLKYVEQFPAFICPMLEVIGIDMDGDTINYQLPLFVDKD